MAFAEDFDTGSDITTDAGFRAWGLAIRTAITDAGIVRTSDTGQIDFGSVSVPSAGSYGGYDIFRFDDAAQATDPIYFKLEYGRGSSSGRHQLRLTPATGSDGSGGLTNGGTARALVTSTGTPSGECYIAASLFDGIFALYDCQNPASTSEGEGITFVIERLRDPTGATGIGWGQMDHVGSTLKAYRRSGGAWSSSSDNMTLAPSQAMYGGQILLGGFCYSNAPSRSWGVLVGPAALPRGMDVVVDVGAGTFTYRVLPVVADYSTIHTGRSGDVCGLLRVA